MSELILPIIILVIIILSGVVIAVAQELSWKRQSWLTFEDEELLKREDFQESLDVDSILDSLGDEYDDPGDDPWGGANLATH